jgi:hypothetical protein
MKKEVDRLSEYRLHDHIGVHYDWMDNVLFNATCLKKVLDHRTLMFDPLEFFKPECWTVLPIHTIILNTSPSKKRTFFPSEDVL